MDERYNFQEIEAKWQRRWAEEQTFRAEDFSAKPKFYVLEMFPYPSGAGLSVGHIKNYGPTDAFCRYKSMAGFNILHPMGWDAFGQPAENEAIKRGRNPRDMVPEYAASFILRTSAPSHPHGRCLRGTGAAARRCGGR